MEVANRCDHCTSSNGIAPGLVFPEKNYPWKQIFDGNAGFGCGSRQTPFGGGDVRPAAQ